MSDSGSIILDDTDITKHKEYKQSSLIDKVFEDPMTGACKELSIEEKLIMKDNLTTLMITHNMKDAIKYGNRLIMMNDARIILDIKGEEKKNLTVKDLLGKFEKVTSDEALIDRMILSN